MISLVWHRNDGPIPAKYRHIANMVSPALEETIIRIEKCVCGETRVIWEDTKTDPWVNHLNSGEH